LLYLNVLRKLPYRFVKIKRGNRSTNDKSVSKQTHQGHKPIGFPLNTDIKLL